MAEPTTITDISDPNVVRSLLYASGANVSAPLNAVSGAALAFGAIGQNVIRYGAKVVSPAAVNAAAFNAAATAAIADSTKTLIANGNYDITGVNADKIHSVFLVGTGSISGVYRKEVFHRMTPGPAASYSSDVIPSVHLKRLNSAYDRTGIINVVLWGDSISTYRPGSGTGPNSATNPRMDLKVMAYRNQLMRCFPGATLNFYDRAIGGQRYQDWDKVDAGVATDYTWYVPGTAWNTHIGALNPDLVILAFGMNYSGSIQELVDIRTYLTTLDCDVLWETNLSPNLAYSGFTQSTFETLDREAGMTRSYPKVLGTDGVIDFHRQCLIARDGFDIRLAHSLDTTKETITPVSNQCVGTKYAYNWKATVVFNASTWANGATDALQVITGSTSDYLEIKKSAGGFWTFQWICTGSSSLSGSLFTSTMAVSTSATAQLTVEVRDDIVTVYALDNLTGNVSEEPVYTAAIVRKTSAIKPYTQLAGITSSSLVSTTFTYAEQRKNMPLITNKDLWDSAYYTATGGVNHPTSAAADLIYGPVLQDLNFRFDSGAMLAVGTIAGTPATTVETTLMSKVIPAKAMKNKHRGEIQAYFVLGANANTKNIRVKLGGTTIYTYTGAQNGGSISISIRFLTDASFTYYWGTVQTTAGAVQVSGAFAVSAWASSTTFALTGENGTATANDIVLRAGFFDVEPKLV